MKMVINEKSKLIGFERKLRLQKKHYAIERESFEESRQKSKELLNYAASQLRKMGLETYSK